MIDRPVTLRCKELKELSKAESDDPQEYRAAFEADHNDLLVQVTIVSRSRAALVGEMYDFALKLRQPVSK